MRSSPCATPVRRTWPTPYRAIYHQNSLTVFGAPATSRRFEEMMRDIVIVQEPFSNKLWSAPRRILQAN